MRKILLSLACASSLVIPVEASAAPYEDSGQHVGMFVGYRMNVSLGGKQESKAWTAFTIAPTLNRVSRGAVHTSIGEGIALNFSPKAKPTLTLAGVRADTVLGLQRNGQVDADGKLGVSTGGWIAIGVGAVALAGAAIYVGRIIECEADPDDLCGSD